MEARNRGAARRDLMHRFLTRFTLLLPDAETARVWARIKNGCARKAAQSCSRMLGLRLRRCG
jgi:predicted nucleic acid-binding protein